MAAAVQVGSAAFRRAVVLASKAIERRSTIPILSMVHCHANGSLKVAGTDLDMTIEAEIERKPDADASFMLSTPRQVVTALAAGGGDQVRIATLPNDKTASIVSDALALTVISVAPEDFPGEGLRPIATDFSVTLDRSHFAAIARVAGAMSSEETRYYLNGIVFEKTGPTTVRIAATDGHRLYYSDIEVADAKGELPGQIIIPRKAVATILDLAKSSEDGVRLEIGQQPHPNRETSTAPDRPSAPRLAVSFRERNASARLVTKLIDGTFPDYRRIIPAPTDRQVVFKTADLRRALVAISGHSRDIRAAKLSFLSGTVNISAAYVDVGLSAQITVSCDHNLDGFDVGFNGSYLLSLLNAAAGDEIVLSFGPDAAHPVAARNPADPSWAGVLMPMRF